MSEQPKPYRTRVDDVPLVEGLTREDGWIDMQVRFLINEERCGSDKLTFGWTVMKPGASHEKHRHFHCDEFLVVMSGAASSSPTRARSRRRRATSSSRRAGTGTASATPATKRRCSSGDGAARVAGGRRI